MKANASRPKGRRDAYRIKDVDAFHAVVPYIMPKRTEAEVFDRETIDVTALMNHIEAANRLDGGRRKLFHAICTATAKTLYFRPLLNSFVSGKRYWQRREITLSFITKKQFADHAEEGLMTLHAEPGHTLDDISDIIIGDVQRIRREGANDLDGVMKFIGSLPRFVLSFVFFVANRLEYFGIMPKALTDGDPNYTSVLLSNLGSLQFGAPYHHLSNYGTSSIVVTIGVIQTHMEPDEQGSLRERATVDIGITLDERIADGYYFVQSIRLLRYFLEHPETLTGKISDPVEHQLF